LVIPGYHAVAKTKIRHSHVMFSDDQGKTWQLGGSAGPSNGECQVAERADGSLYLNARTSQGPKVRTTVVSKDGGETWEKGSYDRTLYDSPCQGAVYRLTPQGKEEKSRWLFSHPALPKRTDLTVRLSYDEGRTWPVSNRLREGNSQYSSLALLPDRSIGCLYDLWQDGNYRLYFARFSLSWLSGGKDTLN
jgi:sialidase-1